MDRNHPQCIIDVINKFPLCKEIRLAPGHRYAGNSFNVLEGYKFAVEAAYACESSLVYLIEEDIWVAKDFFDFHETVQANYDPFCLSAVHCQNDDRKLPNEPASIYYHHTFQSLGISWKVDKLKQVAAHARPEYYKNMRGYIRALAPQSKYGMMWTEQDGLINRIVEASPVKCLYPFVPRAFHAGFVGYNRKGIPLDGTLEERVMKLKTMSPQEMNDHAHVYKDIVPIDLNIDYGVNNFTLVQS